MFNKRLNKPTTLEVLGFVLGFGLTAVVMVGGVWLLEAWVVDALYSNIFEADGATSISFWQWFGIVGVANVLLGGAIRSTK